MFQNNIWQRIFFVYSPAFMAELSPAANVGEFEDIKRKAEAGDANAQTDLGLKYRQGEGVQKNYAEALKWLRKSADQGNGAGQINLGNMYANSDSHGVPVNIEEAANWYRKAAVQENEYSYFAYACLVEMHVRDKNAVSEEEALKWLDCLKKAVDQGNKTAREAMNRLNLS
jgi:TPR repeat protein